MKNLHTFLSVPKEVNVGESFRLLASYVTSSYDESLKCVMLTNRSSKTKRLPLE